MIFGIKSRAAEAAARARGQELFELGMKSALDFRSNDAIDYYTQSIHASPNPAPYINRANLLGKRIRHFEALQDLLRAQQLDRSQGNEFGSVLSFEIARTSALTGNYTNGMRERLIEDFENKGDEYVAGRIVCQAFNIPHVRWEHGTSTDPMLEFHFFNELDNHIKFDDLTVYPEAEYLAEQYPAEFAELKLQQCPDADAYAGHEAILHGFLCSYPVEIMVRLRRTMLYRMHEHMLERDFGGMYNALGSGCNGIIKEADEFIETRAGQRQS